MIFSHLLPFTFTAFIPSLAAAQSVFAHVIVGNTAAYTIEKWASDIELAQSYGIDAFVLNIGTPVEGTTATQIRYAFRAANSLTGQLSTDFKLFLSFDYLGGTEAAWPDPEVIQILQDYASNEAYFQVDGKPLVSTFEGPSNSDINGWSTIRSSIEGGIYFVPAWTSLGPGGFDTSLVDGAFSWDMWPDGPVDVSTSDDKAWVASLGEKSYMMGVSPWFYTDLPQYNKAWVWRGDNAWSLRWKQTLKILPEFVQIVTWNDYGESHYIGPIVKAGIPEGAATYVDGYSHEAWLETLPYQIAAYKHAYNAANAAPTVAAGEEKIVYWYRPSPASAGTTDATGNNCKSDINISGYQTCYPITEILQDQVFAIVLASEPGTAYITIGSDCTPCNVSAGQTFCSKSFGSNNTGTVSVSLGSVSGSGVEITSDATGGVANYNAWVGCAGSCRST